MTQYAKQVNYDSNGIAVTARVVSDRWVQDTVAYQQPISADPVILSVTITSAQVELKAGTVSLVNRLQMIVYPPTSGAIYWGANGLSVGTGAVLNSTDTPMIFDFDPDIPIHIYAISDGTNRAVKVVEIK